MTEGQGLSIVHFDIFQHGEMPREMTYLEAEENAEEIASSRAIFLGYMIQLFSLSNLLVHMTIVNEPNKNFPFTLSERVTIGTVAPIENVEKVHSVVTEIVQGLLAATAMYGTGTSRFG